MVDELVDVLVGDKDGLLLGAKLGACAAEGTVVTARKRQEEACSGETGVGIDDGPGIGITEGFEVGFDVGNRLGKESTL